MQVDNATLALASAVAVALAVNYKLRPPPPQVNPFLLGRQSVASPTRHEGESPVYTNYSNGGVRAPYRPDRNIRTLRDILDHSGTVLEGGQRGLWIHGGEKLVEVVTALRAGLAQRLGSKAGSVLVALEDPTGSSPSASLLLSLAQSILAQTPFLPLSPLLRAPTSLSSFALALASRAASKFSPSSGHPRPWQRAPLRHAGSFCSTMRTRRRSCSRMDAGL